MDVVWNTCSEINSVGCKLCQWAHWQWCWQPFWKVMTSSHKVTDIWSLSSPWSWADTSFSVHCVLMQPCSPSLTVSAITAFVHWLGLSIEHKQTAHKNTSFCASLVNSTFIFCCSFKLSVVMIDWCSMATTGENTMEWMANSPKIWLYVLLSNLTIYHLCGSFDIHWLIITVGAELCNSAPGKNWPANWGIDTF